MTGDLSGIIQTLHETAVGRCRQRLEEAAQKAGGLIRNGEGKSPCRTAYGVTSALKRRHGL